MEIEDRIRELAKAAGIECDAHQIVVSAAVAGDRCWVDGRVRCPYGTPEGQYVLRPEGFCHAQVHAGDGCAQYQRHVVYPELTEEQKSEAVHEHFAAQKTDVTGELRARAEELAEGCPERLALELAADIIEEKNLDRDILLEDDLPK